MIHCLLREGSATPSRTKLRIALRLLLGLIGASVATGARADSEVICAGDCNYDRRATVDELLRGVRITLGSAALEVCVGFDLNGDGVLTIDELVAGVANALAGCPAARLVSSACEVALPAGQDPKHARCGHVIVPEDRRRTDGRTVRVPFVVLRSGAEAPPGDPVVYLNGGPGGSTLDSLQFRTPAAYGPALAGRDLIYFDQRGTGRSRPSLACPEYDQAFVEGLAAPGTAEQDAASLAAALRLCHDRLVGAGINLTAYTSSQNALDVRDLMRALGYREWNLFGVSYGTRLGLTILRDAPEGVRSVILDSVVPVQENLGANFAADFERALDTLVAGCAADAACDALYPDLGTKALALIARFNATPLTIDFIDSRGQPRRLVLTGDRLAVGLQQALYVTDLLPLLPVLITSTFNGDTNLLRSAAPPLAEAAPIAWGMFYSVECGEEFPFVTPEILAAATAGVQEEIRRVALAYVTNRDLAVCDFWNADVPLPTENDAVVSDVPTLVLAGEYDPITRPDYGRLAAQTLSRSSFFEFRGVGHGVLFPTAEPAYFDCAVQLAQQFIADPTASIDGTCVPLLPPPLFFGT
jgi:pimeloyl-ACP methyl ester carboxylesterase